MKKGEIIKRYSKATLQKKLVQGREYYKMHKEELKAKSRKYYEEHTEQVKARSKRYYEEHPEEVRARHQETNRKGGRHYDKQLKKDHTGLRGKRSSLRSNHALQYRPYKSIIAPDSQLHHQWRPGTAEYDGLALVEKDQHMHGFIDVIQILEGEITLFTEEEIGEGIKYEA